MIHDGIAYDIAGDGDWLLMINGIGAARGSWALQIEDLSRHFRCITFDNRGMGESDKPPGPYTTRTMAADAARLLDRLGVKRVHVLGVSMGGAIAQELALLRPELIDRLVIVCSWAACDRYLARCFDIQKDIALSVGRQGAGWSVAVQRFLSLIGFAREDFAGRWDLIADGERQVADALAAGNEPAYEYYVAQADACLTHDTRDRVGRIAAPTLILAADRDAFTPLHLSESLAASIPGASIEIMEGCGHVMFYEQPADFNRRVIRFLSAGHDGRRETTEPASQDRETVV